MKTRKFTALVAAGLLITASQAWSTDLATWSETAAQDFKAQQCVTTPAIPGVPAQCAPDTKVPYPCGTWKNPTKMCNKTVKGPCTPAVPGVPSSKQCASADLGHVSVKADGALATTGSAVQVHNTIYTSILGWNTHYTVSCEVKSDVKFKACVDMLEPTSVQVSSDAVSCNIADGLPTAGLPIAGDVCLFVEANNVASGKPTGSVGAQVSAQVGYGKQNVGGQTIDLGNQSWTETVFKVDY